VRFADWYYRLAWVPLSIDGELPKLDPSVRNGELSRRPEAGDLPTREHQGLIEQRRPTVAVDDPHVGERRDRRIDRDEGLEPRRSLWRSSEQRQQQHRRDRAAPWLTEDAA
jgi:hypothetical protein